VTCPQPALRGYLGEGTGETARTSNVPPAEPQTSSTQPSVRPGQIPQFPITYDQGVTRVWVMVGTVWAQVPQYIQAPEPWGPFAPGVGSDALVPASHAALGFCSSPTTTKSYRTWAWANESLIKDGLGLEHVHYPCRVEDAVGRPLGRMCGWHVDRPISFLFFFFLFSSLSLLSVFFFFFCAN
jgi:hypothetical protein